MKKILLLIFTLFLSSNMIFAIETNTTPVKFIYLNGSNTNTNKSKEDFMQGISKAHQYIKSALENSPFVKSNMLKNGNYEISDKLDIYFWGYQSKEDLNSLDTSLNWTSMFSPRLAQTTRSFISHCMHDAIWVQKSYNMQRLLDRLHNYVLEAHNNGEKVILSGYSAGSFITYEYMTHKLPAVDMDKLLMALKKYSKTNVDEDFTNIYVQQTCLDAITESKLAIYTANGEFIPNDNPETTKSAYKNLDTYTKKYCAPKGSVLGVINFASPLALFYSDRYNQALDINRYNMYMFKYMKENDIFMLTVNFADDPMGFPLNTNLTVKDIERISGINLSKNGHGFVYTKSDIKSSHTFISAHMSYLSSPKKFAKMITDGYIEGYKHFYDVK